MKSLLAFLCFFTVAHAAEPFAKGGREVSLTAGFLYSPVCATSKRPVFNYVRGDLSVGWMFCSPAPLFGCDALRGNWEGLLNVFGAGSVLGSSGSLAGGRVLLRYNFVQPEARWVPFFQVGAGILGNNVYRDRSQKIIGSGFEFTLVADAGVRYFATRQWAVVFMIDFEHISNANTGCRNIGVNALGGSVGVSRFF